MKKQGVISAIYSIIAVVYLVLSLLLTADKNTLFWIGFGIVLVAIVLTAAITMLVRGKQSAAFPIDLATVVLSVLYVGVAIAINLLFGALFKITARFFISIHIVCFALYVILILLMFVTGSSIIKQDASAKGKLCEQQLLICEFEAVRSKLPNLQDAARKQATPLLDALLDDLRFSDLGEADVSDADARLRTMAEMLSNEVDNLAEIRSDDVTSLDAIVKDIRKGIADRNAQIKLMNSTL